MDAALQNRASGIIVALLMVNHVALSIKNHDAVVPEASDERGRVSSMAQFGSAPLFTGSFLDRFTQAY